MVSVSYIIDNTMKTIATREFKFIAVSDEDMEIYPHLAKNAIDEDVEPSPEETVKPEEPTTQEPETEAKPDTEKPVIDENTTDDKKEPVTDVEIPDTDALQTKSVVTALAVFGVALATTVTIKKKED